MSPSKDTSKRSALTGYRILVVDDEPDERLFIATVLEDNGATVLQASDGEEAIALAGKEHPGLITLDLGMPGKSGVDVFVELRSNPALREIPVCIITGRPELRKLIYEKPAITKPEGYLDKPVSEEVLLLGIRKILDLRRRSSRASGE